MAARRCISGSAIGRLCVVWAMIRIDAEPRADLIGLCRVAAARCCAVIFGCHRLRTARCHSVPYGRAALHIRFSDWAILCGLGNDMNRRRTARCSDRPMPICRRAVLRLYSCLAASGMSPYLACRCDSDVTAPNQRRHSPRAQPPHPAVPVYARPALRASGSVSSRSRTSRPPARRLPRPPCRRPRPD